jgi:hypothetical protein
VFPERQHIGIEAAEQEAAIILKACDLCQVMRAILVEGLGISRAFRILRLEQLAGVVEGPAVEWAGIGGLVAALVTADHRAPMRACVEESVELTLAVPRDDDRLATDIAGDVVVVVRDLALVREIDPVSLPDVFHLEFE